LDSGRDPGVRHAMWLKWRQSIFTSGNAPEMLLPAFSLPVDALISSLAILFKFPSARSISVQFVNDVPTPLVWNPIKKGQPHLSVVGLNGDACLVMKSLIESGPVFVFYALAFLLMG
jgi:hypothetical protein